MSLVDKRLEGPVVGVRFENDQVVGEYFLGSDKSPDEFLKEFADTFGTVPQVASLLVEMPKRDGATKHLPLAEVETGSPPFVAEPIPDQKLEEIFGKYRDEDTSARLAFPDWEPQNMHPGTFRSGGSQYFANFIEWGTSTDPTDIPGSFGIEFGIDLYNGAVGTRGSVLPGDICGPNFRDQFIAKNYSWNSWWTASGAGSLALAYPYADLNDFLDSCGRNAMTIGFASPQDMPIWGAGPWGMEITTMIDAKPGVTSSSSLGGGAQLVNSASCPFDGSVAFTDCMGIPVIPPPGVAVSRTSLATWRGWTAAYDKCWASGSWGSAAPTVSTC